MSSTVMANLMLHSAAEGVHRLILLCLADDADREGRAPVTPTLAMKANVSPEALESYLAEMVLEGFIVPCDPPAGSSGAWYRVTGA